MLWVLREESDEMEAEAPDGLWEKKQFNRDQIAGHTKVEVERQAYIDRSIAIREATREAITDQLVDLTDPLVRKKATELMGLPNDLNEKSNVQIDHAKRVWVDFVDEGTLRPIDGTLDDPFLNSQVLGTFLKSDQGQAISEAAGWRILGPLLAGWQEEFAMASMTDKQTRAQYGGEPAPEAAEEKYAELQVQYAETRNKYDESASGALGPLAQQAAQMEEPPTAPLPPVFLPRQIEERIFIVWQSMLQKKIDMTGLYGMLASEQLTPPEQVALSVERFLRFRAIVEGYNMMAGPEAPAPGGMEPPGGPKAGPLPGMEEGGPPVGAEPQPPAAPPTPPVPV
jgi:hypothetical protein